MSDLVISATARPAVGQMFQTLRLLVDRAVELAGVKEIEESVLLNWRLAPDMFPLVFQFQVATEITARGLARLAEAEIPSFANDETTFAALRERIDAVEKGIAALDDAALDGDPGAEITIPMGPEEMTMSRAQFLQGFVLPNLYFHTTAAYLILRHLGAPLGKLDFLGAP